MTVWNINFLGEFCRLPVWYWLLSWRNLGPIWFFSLVNKCLDSSLPTSPSTLAGKGILYFIDFFKKDFIYLFSGEGKGGIKRGRETFTCCPSASHKHPNWGSAYNPGMCPDWRPFALQDDAQPTEPYQLGPLFF